ncbi:alternate-type signal peptide domain-containing protein [Ornithinimicrobium cavernae]|uniref:alternate-type signal peptide domain-containing protein n=1 Tax=Ornithinimicrobium cavernae TaxID=2666047 RepID=UPI000D695523|nr:alternate-type signal peptide domain-containing protein [Ornithinimicrobium cavernae]
MRTTSSPSSTRSATKALVAAGLGVVLLAGAGGTFALWSAEDSTTTGTVTDGHLALDVAAGHWETAAGAPIGDLAAYRMVPGDSITFVTEVTPTIVGDNLRATLQGALPQQPATHWEVVASLPDGLTVVDAGDNGVAIPLTVSVTLPASSGNESQQQVLALDDLTLTLQQVASTM